MDLPLLSCFTSCSHRVLEDFKEDVVEMGGHIGCTHRALSVNIQICDIPGNNIQERMVKVLSITKDRSGIIGIISHSEHIALLVNCAHHASEGGALSLQCVEVGYQHVD